MGWNLINVKGSMLMNEGLRRSKIVELAMPRCGLNDTGGAFIANAISGNATLEKVDLSSNNLSGGTCSVLAESMKVNKKIKHLNLRDNPLGIVGTRKLLQVRRAWRCFKTISPGCSDKAPVPNAGHGGE